MKYTIKFGKRGTWLESVVTGIIGSGISILILSCIPFMIIFLLCLVIVAPIFGLLGLVYLKETK